ncbi:MAG TPA: wax ester/triacylglycerol synthase family O-acyltransferase [Terriglobia bacterium]|nr:wax ester/triacylglycerol synthase family O-acyltransferase [Terriglobia bacterium]
MPRKVPVSAGAERKVKTGRAARRTSGASHAEAPAVLKPPVLSHRLSAADAAFIYLERKEIPLHMASVSIFDGPIRFDEFVASIAAKLHLVPRWRQIVAIPAYNLGLPTWEDDPHFDIHRHILKVTLDRPGGQAELEALAGRILSPLMDRGKPLWDVHVVDGLKDGRGALIWRVHHSLADGVAGAGLVQLMLESTADASRAAHPPRPAAARQRPSEHSAGNMISSAVHGTLDSLIVAEKGVMGLAHSLLGDRLQSGLMGLAGLLPELAKPVERLPFNKPCSGERTFCWTEFDLGRAQAVREAVGGTVNDVILAVLTRALAKYVRLHGQSVVDRTVRIVCPVSLRNGGHNGELGNQISFLPVALPLDVRSPARMLREVAARTSAMKHTGAAGLLGLAAGLLAAAPAPLQAAFWWGIPELILPLPLLNLICTNVPGSPDPLYATGRRMIASYPQVPTGYDLGVGCAVQSYDGKLCVGLIADAHAAPDASRLRDFLAVSFEELCRAAGLKPVKAAPASSPDTGRGTPAAHRARRRPAKPASPLVAAVPAPAAEPPAAAAPEQPLMNVKHAA